MTGLTVVNDDMRGAITIFDGRMSVLGHWSSRRLGDVKREFQFMARSPSYLRLRTDSERYLFEVTNATTGELNVVSVEYFR